MNTQIELLSKAIPLCVPSRFVASEFGGAFVVRYADINAIHSYYASARIALRAANALTMRSIHVSARAKRRALSQIARLQRAI